MIDINDWTKKLEVEFNLIRKNNDIARILTFADVTIAQIDHARTTPIVTDEENVNCLKIIKRIAYNAAADAWPAWDSCTAPRRAAELTQAVKLAERSWACVQDLRQSPMQQGNAVWLIGALYLAQNNRAGAHECFVQAAEYYGQASSSAMRLMAEGYCAIAHNPADLPEILEKLAGSTEEHSAELSKQLSIAHSIFNA